MFECRRAHTAQVHMISHFGYGFEEDTFGISMRCFAGRRWYIDNKCLDHGEVSKAKLDSVS